MADGFGGSITGLEDIDRKMAALSGRSINNATRRSLRKGLNIIKARAVENAKAIDDPKTDNKIWKNITVTGGGSKREKKIQGVMMRLGVKGGAKGYAKASGEIKGKGKDNPGGDTYYWRFHEFGTRFHAAKPLLRKASDDKRQAAFDAVVADLTSQLDKELAKL